MNEWMNGLINKEIFLPNAISLLNQSPIIPHIWINNDQVLNLFLTNILFKIISGLKMLVVIGMKYKRMSQSFFVKSSINFFVSNPPPGNPQLFFKFCCTPWNSNDFYSTPWNFPLISSTILFWISSDYKKASKHTCRRLTGFRKWLAFFTFRNSTKILRQAFSCKLIRKT